MKSLIFHRRQYRFKNFAIIRVGVNVRKRACFVVQCTLNNTHVQLYVQYTVHRMLNIQINITCSKYHFTGDSLFIQCENKLKHHHQIGAITLLNRNQIIVLTDAFYYSNFFLFFFFVIVVVHAVIYSVHCMYAYMLLILFTNVFACVICRYKYIVSAPNVHSFIFLATQSKTKQIIHSTG